MRSLPAVVLFGMLMLLPGGAAYAASSCGGVVQDRADALTTGEEQQVDVAAQRLAATGVRPIVVVAQQLNGVDTEEYLRLIIEACPGLSNADGEWGGNVLGVVVGLDDRETGVWQGGDLPALDVSITNVDTEVMNPRFAEGDVAGGLVAGLDRMASIQAEAAVAEADSGGGGFPWFAGGVGLTALLGGGGAAAAQVLARRRRAQEAHAAAVAAQADLAQSVVDLERDQDIVLLDARALADRLGLAEATPLRQSIAAMTGSVSSILTRWYGVTGQLGPTSTADVATYAQIMEDLRTLAQPINQAVGGVEAFGAQVSRTIALEQGLVGREESLSTVQGRIREGALDAQLRGYRTDPADADLRLSIAALARASQAREHRLVAAADEHLDLAETAAGEAEAWVTGIEQMREDLARELDELRAQHRQVGDEVAPALDAMEALESAYAVSAWESTAGNGSEAEAELASAAAAMDASEQAQLLDVQDWDTAHDALDTAEEDLEDASELLAAIHQRAEELRVATDLAPGLLATAAAAVDTARSFTATHSADVTDSIEAAVADLARRLQATERGLAEVRPDPAAVMAGATQVQTELNELLATARHEVTAADLARRRADRSMAEARATLDGATSYARSRGRYLGRVAADTLQALHVRLERATMISDPVAREAEATTIRAEADRLANEFRRHARVARTPIGPSYRPARPPGTSFGGSSRSTSSRSRGSSSRQRSRGSSSRRRSSSGRSRSGRSSRW